MRFMLHAGDQEIIMEMTGSIPAGALSIDDLDLVRDLRGRLREPLKEVELTGRESAFLIDRMKKLRLVDLLTRLENPGKQEAPPVVVDITGNSR